jgi:release factor glutamine methyltransferase
MKNSIGNAVNEGAQVLSAAGIAQARAEATSLLGHVLNRDRAFIIAHAEDELTENHWQTFQESLARRAGGEPFQYITGRQEFFKLDFEVSRDVLIPRPETEILVAAALEVLKDDPAPQIADIGTGSGCIVISLLHEVSNARAVALDISGKALRVARRNAVRHGVIERTDLIQADSFSAFRNHAGFSLVVSNPPYIAESEVKDLQREVRDHEPLSALVSGADGLSHIRALVRHSPSVLSPDGFLIFEIGFGQHDAVEKLIDAGVWRLVEVRNDLQNIPRTVVLQKR